MPALNSRVVGIIDVNTSNGQDLPGVDADRFACDTCVASMAAIIKSIYQTTRPCVPSTSRFSMAEFRYANDDVILADVRQLSEDLKQEWLAFIVSN